MLVCPSTPRAGSCLVPPWEIQYLGGTVMVFTGGVLGAVVLTC